MCRSVELDYVDRGEGVCYRLLRSVSCLQQLHHDNILPLQVVNLDATTNRLTLFYEDAGAASVLLPLAAAPCRCPLLLASLSDLGCCCPPTRMASCPRSRSPTATPPHRLTATSPHA